METAQEPTVYRFAPRSTLSPDVEVIIKFCGYHIFQVHSQLLRTTSTFFDASLSSRWWRDENTITDAGSIKYRYILSEDPNDFTMSILVPTREAASELPRDLEFPDNCKPKSGHPKMRLTFIGKEARLEAYKNMFSAFYGGKPYCKTLGSAEVLVELAEKYDCLRIVGPLLQNTLRLEQRYWIEMADNPIKTLSIATRLRSKLLFREAFITCVGVLVSYGEEEWWATHVDDSTLSELPDRVVKMVNAERTQIKDLEACKLVLLAQMAAGLAKTPFSKLTSFCDKLNAGDRILRVLDFREFIAELKEYDLHGKGRLDNGEALTKPIEYQIALLCDKFEPLLRINLDFTRDVCPYKNHAYLCAEIYGYPWDEDGGWVLPAYDVIQSVEDGIDDPQAERAEKRRKLE